jgi:hypothetical protein
MGYDLPQYRAGAFVYRSAGAALLAYRAPLNAADFYCGGHARVSATPHWRAFGIR